MIKVPSNDFTASTSTTFVLVQNWLEELKQRFAGR
jgi:hypothetical protein